MVLFILVMFFLIDRKTTNRALFLIEEEKGRIISTKWEKSLYDFEEFPKHMKPYFFWCYSEGVSFTKHFERAIELYQHQLKALQAIIKLENITFSSLTFTGIFIQVLFSIIPFDGFQLDSCSYSILGVLIFFKGTIRKIKGAGVLEGYKGMLSRFKNLFWLGAAKRYGPEAIYDDSETEKMRIMISMFQIFILIIPAAFFVVQNFGKIVQTLESTN